MAWSYEIVDTLSGDRLMAVEPVSAPWALRMNGQLASGDFEIQTRDPMYKDVTAEMWRSLRDGTNRTIVGKWRTVPVWAGVISDEVTYSLATGVLTLPHTEVGHLMTRRQFFGAAATYEPLQRLSFGPFTRLGMLISIARHVAGGGVHAPVTGTQSPWRLPIFFPVSAPGGWSQTVFHHEFREPWREMVAITEEDGGPDFVFVPGFNTQSGTGDEITQFQWTFVAGEQLERSVQEYQIDAPDCPLSEVTVGWQTGAQLTGAFMLGEGSGEDRIVGSATPRDSRVMPAMDAAFTAARGTSKASLDQQAAALLRTRRSASEVWSFKVHADVVLAALAQDTLSGIRPGSRVRLRWGTHPILGAAGYRDLLVVGLSGEHKAEMVTVEVQVL